MTDRTHTTRQNPATTTIERFRCEPDGIARTLVFEQSHDLALAAESISGDRTIDLAEAQVLIRHNVDGDEGLSIVYVDGPHGRTDDAALLAEVAGVLQKLQETLALLEGGAR